MERLCVLRPIISQTPASCQIIRTNTKEKRANKNVGANTGVRPYENISKT